MRKFILRGARAAQAENIIACAGMVWQDYRDKYGNDRASLIAIGREVFGYYRRISVHIESIKIDLNDTRTEARVEIVALVLGQTQQNSAEKILEADKARCRVRLVKEKRKWYLGEIEAFEPITLLGQNIA